MFNRCVVGHALLSYLFNIFLVSTNSEVHETHVLHVTSMMHLKLHLNHQFIKSTVYILFHNLEIFFFLSSLLEFII